MNPLELVDELYAAFEGTLYGPLVECARSLPETLGLAPNARVPWSRVFSNPITLAAPALFADAMREAPERAVRDAVLAHMLAVIEAFGTDRIEDGQIQPTPPLMALLGALRRGRDRALKRVAPHTRDPRLDFAAADQKMLYAITCEHGLMRQASGATFATYETVSLGKQAVGFPATLALAHAAGWDERRRAALYEALANVWLGLQMNDDVVDWEDDLSRGGAWAVAIARAEGAAEAREDRLTEAGLRRRVFSSRVLERMLTGAYRHFRSARRRASALGSHEVAGWAGGRESKIAHLLAGERTSAGYAARAHALAAWATEVLA